MRYVKELVRQHGVTVELTNRQRGMIRALIVSEARALGYGTRWHEYNRPEWPRRLKQLAVIAGKLSTWVEP